jgi:hypothetical protein
VSGTKNILSIFGLELLSDEVAGHFCHEYHPSGIQNKKQRKHLTLICTSTKNIHNIQEDVNIQIQGI